MEPAGKNRTARGREGEAAVAAILVAEGWSILEKNFRSRRGEIDIIALKDGCLSFVEVKTWKRSAGFFLPDAIGDRKRSRIIETSKFFISRYRQYNWKKIRYDVFLLSPDGGERVRYEGAFDETV